MNAHSFRLRLGIFLVLSSGFARAGCRARLSRALDNLRSSFRPAKRSPEVFHDTRLGHLRWTPPEPATVGGISTQTLILSPHPELGNRKILAAPLEITLEQTNFKSHWLTEADEKQFLALRFTHTKIAGGERTEITPQKNNLEGVTRFRADLAKLAARLMGDVQLQNVLNRQEYAQLRHEAGMDRNFTRLATTAELDKIASFVMDERVLRNVSTDGLKFSSDPRVGLEQKSSAGDLSRGFQELREAGYEGFSTGGPPTPALQKARRAAEFWMEHLDLSSPQGQHLYDEAKGFLEGYVSRLYKRGGPSEKLAAEIEEESLAATLANPTAFEKLGQQYHSVDNESDRATNWRAAEYLDNRIHALRVSPERRPDLFPPPSHVENLVRVYSKFVDLAIEDPKLLLNKLYMEHLSELQRLMALPLARYRLNSVTTQFIYSYPKLKILQAVKSVAPQYAALHAKNPSQVYMLAVRYAAPADTPTVELVTPAQIKARSPEFKTLGNVRNWSDAFAQARDSKWQVVLGPYESVSESVPGLEDLAEESASLEQEVLGAKP